MNMVCLDTIVVVDEPKLCIRFTEAEDFIEDLFGRTNIRDEKLKVCEQVTATDVIVNSPKVNVQFTDTKFFIHDIKTVETRRRNRKLRLGKRKVNELERRVLNIVPLDINAKEGETREVEKDKKN